MSLNRGPSLPLVIFAMLTIPTLSCTHRLHDKSSASMGGPATATSADLTSANGAAAIVAAAPDTAPMARVERQVTTLHGIDLVDDYRWLRQRDNPQVISYLEAENAYTEAVMAHTQQLQETLYREMVGRIQENDLSVPTPVDHFFYYTRSVEGSQYKIYCRKRGSLDATEEVLLDVNRLAEGHDYFRIGGFKVSPDHRLLAYSYDTAGGERYTLRVKDLSTGELLADTIEKTTYGIEWGNHNKTLFYVVSDAANRPYQLKRHRLGQPSAGDEVLYHEQDERFFVNLGKSRSRRFLLVSADSALTSEAYFLDADRPEEPLQLFAARRQGIEYRIDHQGDHFFIRTNEEAKNFKLLRTPLGAIGRDNWQLVIAHRPETQLEWIEVFERFLVVVERHEGLRRFEVRPIDGAPHYIEMPEPVYTVFPTDNRQYEAGTLRFRYTSMVTPASVFDYNLAERTRELLKQTEVRGGYDPADYGSERIFATAGDGTRIPISLVFKRGTREAGPAPLWLSGYGSYGTSREPYFSSARLSMLDRGFVYAIAHVRGGGEMGEPWHDDGKLLNKRNTFTDFIACAEHLIATGYADPDRLAISGGSAGGLLIGAVLNLRPDLFTVAHAAVPFVDVMNTMLDPTIPLTVTEYEEWGNPNEKEYFEYMLSYSPYDNVEAKEYPHLLVTAGLNDPRVQYWEPAKWTAKLRANKTGDHRLLLKTNMGAGHGGASGRYSRLHETAFEYAFFLDTLGIGSGSGNNNTGTR